MALIPFSNLDIKMNINIKQIFENVKYYLKKNNDLQDLKYELEIET